MSERTRKVAESMLQSDILRDYFNMESAVKASERSIRPFSALYEAIAIIIYVVLSGISYAFVPTLENPDATHMYTSLIGVAYASLCNAGAWYIIASIFTPFSAGWLTPFIPIFYGIYPKEAGIDNWRRTSDYTVSKTKSSWSTLNPIYRLYLIIGIPLTQYAAAIIGGFLILLFLGIRTATVVHTTDVAPFQVLTYGQVHGTFNRWPIAIIWVEMILAFLYHMYYLFMFSFKAKGMLFNFNSNRHFSIFIAVLLISLAGSFSSGGYITPVRNFGIAVTETIVKYVMDDTLPDYTAGDLAAVITACDPTGFDAAACELAMREQDTVENRGFLRMKFLRDTGRFGIFPDGDATSGISQVHESVWMWISLPVGALLGCLFFCGALWMYSTAFIRRKVIPH